MAGLSTKYGFGEYNKSRAEQKREMEVGDNQFGKYARNLPNNNPDTVSKQPTPDKPQTPSDANDVTPQEFYTKTPEQMRQNAVAEKAQAQQREAQRQQSAVEKFNAQQPAEKDPQGVERPTNPKDIADMVYGKRIDPVSALRPDANVVRDDINRDIEPQEVERKHGWRDWFRNTGDEEYENRKRERVAAFSDMIRHLANLHYVNQYATPQHIESAYGKVKAEEKEQRKLKREQENEDRKWNWKISEAQRDQANKDRTYGLGVRKDKRAEALQPEKEAKAKAEKEYAEEKARIQKAVGEGKISEQEAKTKTQEAKAKYADALEKSKIDKNKATANKENAHAGYYNRKDANGGGGRGGSGGGKTTQYNHSDSNYVWDVPVSSQSQLNSNLRTIVTKEKNSKWVEDYKRRTDKMTLSEGDYDRIAREHIGDPEIQRAISKTGAKARKVEKKKSKTQL